MLVRMLQIRIVCVHKKLACLLAERNPKLGTMYISDLLLGMHMLLFYELPLLLPSFIKALELGHHLHITLHSFIDFTWTSSLYQVIRHLHKVSNTIGLTLNYLNINIL